MTIFSKLDILRSQKRAVKKNLNPTADLVMSIKLAYTKNTKEMKKEQIMNKTLIKDISISSNVSTKLTR